MDVTVDQVKYLLTTQPQFLIEVIIDNNIEAVKVKLHQYFGSSFHEEGDGVKEFVFEILEVGTKEEKRWVMDSLRVPFIADNASDTLNLAQDFFAKAAQAKMAKGQVNNFIQK